MMLSGVYIYGMNIWADINYPNFDEDPLVIEVMENNGLGMCGS